MTDVQKTVVDGVEYTAKPSGPCCGCAADGDKSLCHNLPSCNDIIFVKSPPISQEYRAGYAAGLLAKQVEWDKYKADRAATNAAFSAPCVRADGYAKGLAVIGTVGLPTPSLLDPSGAAGVYGVARTSDPATSHKAANKLSLRKAGRIADLILVELRNANLTGSELAARTGVALNSITPRFSQLSRKGLIHAAGGSGRETVWAIGNGIKA